MNIFELAKSRPDQWIRDEDCETEQDSFDLAEGGGLIRWCTTCQCWNQPNRPCWCGAMLLRSPDGRYWAGIGAYGERNAGWIEDWKEAEHWYGDYPGLVAVAESLFEDCGPLTIVVVSGGKGLVEKITLSKPR